MARKIRKVSQMAFVELNRAFDRLKWLEANAASYDDDEDDIPDEDSCAELVMDTLADYDLSGGWKTPDGVIVAYNEDGDECEIRQWGK